MSLDRGMYRTAAGDIFKVQLSKTTGFPYALRLAATGGNRLAEAGDVVHFEFVYAPGAVRALDPAMRMTLEDAMEFGVKTGTCCVCGIRLKDAQSVARGIGPTCAKRETWNQGVLA